MGKIQGVVMRLAITGNVGGAMIEHEIKEVPLTTAQRFDAIGRLVIDGFFCAKQLENIRLTGDDSLFQQELHTAHYLKMFCDWTGSASLRKIALIGIVGLSEGSIAHKGESVPLAFNRLVLLAGECEVSGKVIIIRYGE